LPIPERDRDLFQLVPVVLPGGLGPHKYNDRRRLDAVELEDRRGSAIYDVLLTDCDGSLLETGRGNIFVVTDDAVRTPALDGRLLPGVTRQRAIDELARAGVDVVQGRLTLADLDGAAEVFVTSSLDRVQPIRHIESVGFCRSGPTAGWLRRRLSVPRPAPLHAPAGGSPGNGPPGRGVRLLLIDNYDSFVYNLDQLVRELGASTDVVRNDATTVDEVAAAAEHGRFHGVIVSPGPGRPTDAGISTALIQRLGPSIPVLGVCLGHQCVAEAYGARVVVAETVVHGKQSLVHHDGAGVFAGLEGPLQAGRYHSLVVSEQTLPPELQATAHSAGRVLMGVRHRDYRVEGVQIHPESILTPLGRHLLGNFLQTCATAGAARPSTAGARE
jgi:para-aminobenzoate synthetase/4-amino-4-deoxychorismate lyase